MEVTTRSSHSRVADRVAEILAERIQSGVYSSGETLPTERVLAADLGVHRRSVRAAVGKLVQNGLAYREPNCRPKVGQPPEKVTERAVSERSAPGGNQSSPKISGSNLIALLMWHGGGPLEHAGTAQQRIFWGMNNALRDLGYHAVFLDLGGHPLGSENENAAREAIHLRYLRDHEFGGAVFYPYAYRHNVDLVRDVSSSVPLVLLDRRINGIDIDFVGIENRRSMFEIVQHLIALGHRRIAYVTGYEPIHSVQDRIHGYLDAIHGPGASERQEMILTLPSYQDDRDWAVIDMVFGQPREKRPTAAVCVSDYLAVHLAERLEYLGLSVPDDVALTGFDDIIAALPNGLGLTTAAQPFEAIGEGAVELLMRRIEQPLSAPKYLELPANLIVRGSTAP